jgi:transcriptional regulator with XRE-family HTH domain
MHSLTMHGSELLKALMDRDGLNSNSLAVKLRNKSLQSHVYRYLKGVAKEPKIETLRPIAEHFDVPLAAFYDSALAEQVAVERGLLEGSMAQPRPTTEKTLSPSDAFDAALEVIAKALTEVDEEARALVGHSLSRLAQDPSKLSNISQHIRTLVFTNIAKQGSTDTETTVSELPDLPRGIGPEDGEHLRISPPAQRGGKK